MDIMNEIEFNIPKHASDFIDAQEKLIKRFKITPTLWKRYVDPIIEGAKLCERERLTLKDKENKNA